MHDFPAPNPTHPPVLIPTLTQSRVTAKPVLFAVTTTAEAEQSVSPPRGSLDSFGWGLRYMSDKLHPRFLQRSYGAKAIIARRPKHSEKHALKNVHTTYGWDFCQASLFVLSSGHCSTSSGNQWWQFDTHVVQQNHSTDAVTLFYPLAGTC